MFCEEDQIVWVEHFLVLRNFSQIFQVVILHVNIVVRLNSLNRDVCSLQEVLVEITSEFVALVKQRVFKVLEHFNDLLVN